MHNLSAVLNDSTSRSRVKLNVSRLSFDSSSTSSGSPPSTLEALVMYRSALLASLAPAASERTRASESGVEFVELASHVLVPLAAHLGREGSLGDSQRECAEALDRVEDALSLSLSSRAAQLWALLRRLHALHRSLLAVLPLLGSLHSRILTARTAYVSLAETTQGLRRARQATEHSLDRLRDHEALDTACAAVEVLLLHSRYGEGLQLLTQRSQSLPELSRARAWRSIAARVAILRERAISGLANEIMLAILQGAPEDAERWVSLCLASGEDALLNLADVLHGTLIDRLDAAFVVRGKADVEALVELIGVGLGQLKFISRGCEILRNAGATVRAQALLIASTESVALRISSALRESSLIDHTVQPERVASLLDALSGLTRHVEQWLATRASSVLRSATLALGRIYIDALRTHALHALTSSLDAETWTSSRVTSEYQALFDSLVDVTTQIPMQNLSDSVKSEPEALRISPERVVTPCASTLLLLKHAHTLTRATSLFIPTWRAIAADAARALGELLHSFNTRAFALILRQGSLQTGALKGIAVRHLAQVAATLDVLVVLVRALRAANSSLFGGGGVEARLLHEQYSQLLSHIEQHSQQLMDKFVELMVERAVAIIPKLLSGPMEEKKSLGLDELEKKLLVLHKALKGTLSEFQTRAVLIRVLSAYRRLLREALSSLESPLSLERKSCLCDEARALDTRTTNVLHLDAHEALALALLPVLEDTPTASETTGGNGSAIDGGIQAAQRLLSTFGWDTNS